MGKRGGRGWRGSGRGGGRGGGGWSNSRPSAYPEINKHNDVFEGYYNQLGLMPLEEMADFWECLRKELPNSFRFCGSKGHALAVQQRLVDYYIPQITSVKYNDEFVQAPRPIEWFPEKLAWMMTTPKQVVRKFPPFASFQKFLVSETTVGNISRQEIVSMIPPLLMGIRPGMTVLDMCAAPGSKTAQLIEAIHGGEEARARRVAKQVAREEGRETSPDGMEIDSEQDQADREDDYSDDGRSTGLLVANDVEYKRAQMLVHQVKRLNSPNIVVTNHDATMFPSIKVGGEASGKWAKYLKFDRILADVPCSGDGTARKNPNIWKDWTPGNALGLYSTQVKILIRALQMLKVGGRVVYSTCSLNPIENEAVVATAIDLCGGIEKVRLVDCSEALPGLQRRSGLNSWQVMDKRQTAWKSWDALDRARESGEPEGAEKLVRGMFPPPEDDRIPLDRCLRVYPHLQDTGGFFICVLEKQTEIRPRQGNSPRAVKAEEAAPPVPEASKEIMSANDIEPEPVKLKRSLEDAGNDGGDETPAKKTKIYEETLQKVSAVPQPASEQLSEFQTPAVVPATVNEKVDIARPAVTEFPKKKSNQPHEEPFKYLDPTHPELEGIFKFYQLSSRFPRDRFMVRNATGEPVKAIYYTSVLARTILQLNEGKGMKFVHCGVKMFVKQDAQGQDICRWRIQSEGLPIVEPWVGEGRIVRLYKRPTLRKMLREMFLRISGCGWQELGEIGERVRDMGMGCGVLRVEHSDEKDGFKERIILPMWRSLHSVNLMLPKEERKAMLLRLFNDESELIDHSQRNKESRPAAASEKAPTPGSPVTLPATSDAAASIHANGGPNIEATGSGASENGTDNDTAKNVEVAGQINEEASQRASVPAVDGMAGVDNAAQS